ncbi:MAG TPA: dual specificity protein phosphatase family protein [Thermoplasmata archaeon]|nr:dual specificity protein phosphatase family protein [Thermoplasmata archaeon]
MPNKAAGKTRKPTPKSPAEFAPQVFVGGWDDALKFDGAKFCVLDAEPDDMPPATHIPIYNESADRADPKNLDRLVEGMRDAHAKGKPVLVFCGHGMYRSPLGAAWYLHRTEGLTLEQAYAKLQAVRPKAKPAAGWVGNYAELQRA